MAQNWNKFDKFHIILQKLYLISLITKFELILNKLAKFDIFLLNLALRYKILSNFIKSDLNSGKLAKFYVFSHNLAIYC